MCLDRVFRGKEKREALAKLPNKFVVGKIVRFDVGDAFWTTEFSPRTKIRAGRMRAPYLGLAYKYPVRCSGERLRGKKAYRAGWHAYLRFKLNSGHTRCVAYKKDIRAIGVDKDQVVVVLSHITFPKKCGRAP